MNKFDVKLCWKKNYCIQLYVQEMLPWQFSPAFGVLQILSFGWNVEGQLGHGSTAESSSAPAEAVHPSAAERRGRAAAAVAEAEALQARRWTQVSAGYFFTAAIDDQGVSDAY